MKKNNYVITEENKKQYVKRQHMFLGVTVATFYGFNVLASNIGYILKKFDKRDSIKDMKISISNNNNINKEEKEYLNGIDVFLNDYEQYIDIPLVCDRLEKFDIIYKNSSQESSVITTGKWSRDNDKIIYYITDFDSEERRKKVINHELLHLVSFHDNYYPSVLTEGVTSTICCEYNLNEDSYSKYRLITYMLCEIVSSDIVIESYLKGDFSIIEKKLYEIIPDNKLIENLKLCLDNSYEYNHIVSKYIGLSFDNTELSIFNKCRDMRSKSLNSVSEILCDYYTAKTKKMVGDSHIVDSMYHLKDGYSDFDIKMSIYNTELRKNDLFTISEWDNKIGKYLVRYEYYNKFNAVTSYFNKRNESNIYFCDDEKWGFSVDLQDKVLKSNIEITRKFIKMKEQQFNELNKMNIVNLDKTLKKTK